MTTTREIDEDVWSTFLEAWPTDLFSFAIPARSLPLDAADARAMLSATPQVASTFGIGGVFDISENLKHGIAAVIEDLVVQMKRDTGH